MTATTKPVDVLGVLRWYEERCDDVDLSNSLKTIAELIAADVEYDRLRLIWLGSQQLEDFHRFDLASERRAAALAAIQGENVGGEDA